ncbi:hypothetical protein PRZ01_19125, partial [Paucibacter sp. hw1]|nr:hypothetical protein [Roseateles koreensis]
ILITHSMGGLVARRCQQLGMAEQIAGVIHGVMPAIGAPVAYRRTKAGMGDESMIAGWVIGSLGSDVTPVFAQAPGALQLLPNAQYPKGWLRLLNEKGQLIDSFPKADPYEEIYLNRKDWWGLVKEEWLRPKGGVPIDWAAYVKFGLDPAKSFHASLGTSYHPNTYVFCGEPDNSHEKNSIANVSWRMNLSPYQLKKIDDDKLAGLPHSAFLEPGGSYVLKQEPNPNYNPQIGGSYRFVQPWSMVMDLFDAGGDGTVPAVSGRAPLTQSPLCIQQQVRLAGFGHENAYKNGAAQDWVLYALAKILKKAKVPQVKP